MDYTSVKKTFHRRELKAPCVDFSDPKDGRKYFLDALKHDYLEGYFPLSTQFQSQSHYAYCGISSLSMSLNTLLIDPNRIYSGVWRWWDDSMLNCCDPLEEVKVRGITLPKLACLSRCSGVKTSLIYASDITYEQFHSDILKSCNTICSEIRPIIIASYSRKLLNQTGDGHYSPIAAYSPTYDQVLIMDVARFKYPPYWVPMKLLFEAMQKIDKDTGKSRGYLMLQRGAGMQQHIELLCRCEVEEKASCSSSSSSSSSSDNDTKGDEVVISNPIPIDDCSKNRTSITTTTTNTTCISTFSKKEKEKEEEILKLKQNMEIEKQKKVMDRLEKENQELKERLHSFATYNCSDCNCEFCCEAVSTITTNTTKTTTTSASNSLSDFNITEDTS